MSEKWKTFGDVTKVPMVLTESIIMLVSTATMVIMVTMATTLVTKVTKEVRNLQSHSHRVPVIFV